MNPKQRTTVVQLVFWSVAIGVPCFLLWREDQQQRLNQELLAAINREDTPAALRALEHGADGDARDEPAVSAWQRIWDALQGRGSDAFTAPTALLMSLRGDELVASREYIFARNENPELVEALLAHGARVDVTDQQGHTPLWIALIDEKTATARLLIKHGANVGAAKGETNLLFTAIVCANDADTVELMLRRGADPNRASAAGETPLGAGVFFGNPATVRRLLRYHADPNLRTVFDGESTRPLNIAEREHLPEIAKLLRDAGARK